MAVSIHAPARGATVSPEQAAASIAGFNPRPCTRGDRFCRTGDGSVKVSIHAPARGATVWDKNFRAAFSVSIHAPARGATRIKPYTSERRRQVSIHAPARGATRHAEDRQEGGWRFNPRPCTRGDRLPAGKYMTLAVSIHAPARGATHRNYSKSLDRKFQSTPLHEGRRARAPPGRDKGLCFNPRPCTRGDRP